MKKLVDICLKIQTSVLAWCNKKPKLSCLLLGMLLTAALPPTYQIWLIFPCFSIALYLCMQTSKLRSLIAYGYWFGFGFFAAGFYWVGNALLVDAARTGWIYPFALILSGAFFGLFSIIPFAASKIGHNLCSKMLLFSSLWCLCTEMLRGYLFTGFPWNPLSSVLAFSPALLQTLSWWGTYGLSLVVVMLSLWPTYWLLHPTKKSLAISLSAVLVLFVMWNYGGFTIAHRPRISDGKSLMVRLVQPSISQKQKWNRAIAEQNLQDYIDLSKAQDNRFIDFVIWGETAVPYDLTSDERHRQKIKQVVPRHGYLISGFLRRENNGEKVLPYNSLAVINRHGQVVETYDKNHLVPFGEYIPGREYLPKWIKPVANNVAEFGRGTKYQTISLESYPAFAPLICYEIIFPGEILPLENKPKWVVLLTNDGWYGLSSGPYQHLVAAQMRAVEEGVTVVRSANSGISAVITPYGQIRASLGLHKKGVLDVAIKPDAARDTLFGRYGNIVPIGMSLFLILLALCFRGRHKS